jgi:hypothetical protein
MFPTTHSTPLFASRGRARALETWREAASLVATRWQNFLDADAPALPPGDKGAARPSYLRNAEAVGWSEREGVSWWNSCPPDHDQGSDAIGARHRRKSTDRGEVEDASRIGVTACSGEMLPKSRPVSHGALKMAAAPWGPPPPY